MNILRVLLPTILCTLCFLSAWVAFPQRSCMIPSPASYRCCCCLVIQSCPTLCDPIDYTQPGSSVHGIFQARKLKFPSPEDLLKNIKLALKKYWKKDKVLKWNKPEAHETASTDTALLKTHHLDFVLLGSVQMLERGHKDWEGTRGCRMAQEQSGGIRQRKDDAAAMVNATVKFRKRMQTLMKGF